KGILPSYEGQMGWINGTNNWNQVCNGGMIAAAIMIADRDPELAAKTISRALEGMPQALAEYGPDGVYPEVPRIGVMGPVFLCSPPPCWKVLSARISALPTILPLKAVRTSGY